MKKRLKTIHYQFKFNDGSTKELKLQLDYPSMRLEVKPRSDLPDWTRLAFHKCPNCPLDEVKHSHCPAAVALVDVIELFKESFSTEITDIVVSSENREYHKEGPLQYGVGSLMGLSMATSGCPILDKLRPMVYTHLPFSGAEEMLFRAMSMYLVAQFLLHKRGKNPDWNMDHFMSLFHDVNVVNQSFSKRLLSINPKDASLNGLVNLDSAASFAMLSLTKNYMSELEALFEPYLHEKK